MNTNISANKGDGVQSSTMGASADEYLRLPLLGRRLVVTVRVPREPSALGMLVVRSLGFNPRSRRMKG